MARRANGSLVMAPRTVAYRHTATHTAATATSRAWIRTRYVARYSVGMVTMSPAAVTSGVDTVSRSYPRRYESTDSPTVSSRITAEPSTPPTTEIVTKSRNEMESSPKASAANRASTARYSEDENVV